MLSKIIEFLYLGANFSESVGPNSAIIGTYERDSMCITPLSIDIAKFNLFPRQTTKAGPLSSDSCSGNKAPGINLLIFFLVKVA